MTVEATDVRKVVVLSWDTEIVKGKTASIQAEGRELRVVPNKGAANVFYPSDYTGSTEFVIEGSKQGTDTGTVSVTGEESGGPDEPIIDNGGDASVNTAQYVYYNDGNNDSVYALVTQQNGDTLNLQTFPATGEPEAVNGVPQREPEDYGDEGGGRTWHTDPIE